MRRSTSFTNWVVRQLQRTRATVSEHSLRRRTSTEDAGGRFWFIADNEYVMVQEWGGGKMSAFYVYATKPNLKKILAVSTAATRHEVISPNQLQLFEVSDIEGLWKCPPSHWPYDTVVYTFFPDRADRHIKKKGEISEYCRNKLD